jgi:polyisoprenoid-binding protein YceI
MTIAAATTYTIDPVHSSVEFSVRHMMLSKVRGVFRSVAGTVTIDPSDVRPTAVSAEIEIASLDTRDAQRDTHLKSEDFLHAEAHSHIRFTSTSVTPKDGHRSEIAGNLEIRGTTQPVVLETEFIGRTTDPWGNDRIAFEASTRISRKAFGLTWNQVLETGAVIVGDEIDIELQIQAVAKP